MVALVIVTIALSAILLVPSAYLLALTMAGLLYRPRPRSMEPPSTRFAILIPAHNEELLLPRLLDNLQRVDYPHALLDVHVVADNCTDGTAKVAGAAGVTVHERRDTLHRGKGHALQWLLQQMRESGVRPDAYVFLDADCLVSPNFFSIIDARIRAGQQAVQSYYTVANPFESPAATLRYLALVLMHHVRPKGRQALRLSCGLFGTGMAFRREVLDLHDWDAYTLAEDVEYYLKLTDNGIRVDFAPEAVVSSDMPARLRDARSQNLRWEKGRIEMARRYSARFLFEGIKNRNPIKIDAAIQEALPPLSITLPAAVLLLAIAFVTGNGWAIGMAAAVNGAFAGHVVIGLLSARVPARAYRALGYAPFFVAWKLFVYVLALRPGRSQWVRTARPRE